MSFEELINRIEYIADINFSLISAKKKHKPDWKKLKSIVSITSNNRLYYLF